MADKKVYEAKVLKSENLASGIYSLILEAKEIASEAKAGQFVGVYSKDNAHLLPRPISLCEIDKEAGTIRLVFRAVGFGTEEFSKASAGDSLRVIGPLGNGYPELSGEIMVMGGGIGIPPMLELAKANKGHVKAVIGYRDEQYLRKDFDDICPTFVATEDGSDGTKGNVIDAIKANDLKADVICACGPGPMLRAIKAYALENGITCYVSLEEKMGCGIGACLACVCKSVEVDDHSLVHNKRICKEGPVFLASEVEF